MKRLFRCLILILLASSPAFSQLVVDEIAAKVNSEIILKSDIERQRIPLNRELEEAGLRGAELSAAIALESKNLLRNLIDESLLIQKAREYGIDSDADLEVLRTMDRIRQDNDFETLDDLDAAILAQGDTPEGVREGIRNQYLSQQVLNREVRSRIIVTTEELRAYYEEHQQEFDRPRGVNLAEIVKVVGGKTPEEAAAVRAEMEAILERIRDGEDFFEIASEESESTSAPDGGVLGYFGDGMLGPEFERAANGLPKNEVSEIFEVGDVLAIIKLLERHEGGILSFDLARTELESILVREKEAPRIREYLTRLRADGFVEVREGYIDTGAVQTAVQTEAGE